jgi:hypothetical protein
VVDHVSASWAIDENVSTWYPLKNVTISNCLISEALNNSIHPKGNHSMGILLGDGAHNMTLVGNLFAHNAERNPRIKGDVEAVIINNVFYNSGGQNFSVIGHNSGPNLVTVVGNIFLAGPNTPAKSKPLAFTNETSEGSKVYFYYNQTPEVINFLSPYAVPTPPIWHESLAISPLSGIEEQVLSKAGARPADRDVIDTRIVNEVRNREGKIIDSQSQVGGWPELTISYRPFMIPSNLHSIDGYTNIERVLHRMAKDVEYPPSQLITSPQE